MDENLDTQSANLLSDDASLSSSEENVSQSSGESRSITTQKLSRNRSTVWKLMKECPSKNLGAGKTQVQCKLCSKKFIHEVVHGTSNMRRHLRYSCPKRGKALKIFSPVVGDRTSVELDQGVFREALALSIIRHEYPFQYVEHEATRKVFTILNPEVECITRNTIKADNFKIFRREKEKLQHLIQSTPGRICLTSDMSSSSTTDGYMCVTGHFVDSEWKLHKKILNFMYMPAPHTGSAIAAEFSELMSDWGIEEKLFSISLDNASANTTFCESYESRLNRMNALILGGRFFRIRCCAHILNLIVQDGLKEIDEAVFKIRETVKYLKNSQWRKEKFVKCLNDLGLKGPRRMRQDVPGRWNSTYLMIERALLFRTAFPHYELSDNQYHLCPSDEEWGRLEEISKFLKLFYELTTVFSGTTYPTANLYFHGVWKIELHLKGALNSQHDYLKQMAKRMKEKFDKYWSDFSEILSIAMVLDPRYKMKMIEFSYNKLYGDNGPPRSNRVREQLYSLFNEYIHLYSTSPSDGTSSLSTTQDGDGVHEVEDDMAGFDLFQSQMVPEKKSELDLYLEEACLDWKQNLDILMHWKSVEYRFPILAKMARDILTIPISTVASEAAFSSGGRVLDQYRTSLTPSVVEALICTKDWLFGSKVVMKNEDDSLEVDLLDSSSTSSSTVASHVSLPKRTKLTTSRN